MFSGKSRKNEQVSPWSPLTSNVNFPHTVPRGSRLFSSWKESSTTQVMPFQIGINLTFRAASASSLWRQLKKIELWIEAGKVVLRMLHYSVLSGVVTLLLTYICTLGNFLSRKSVAEQSYPAFATVMVVVLATALCTSMLVVSAMSLRTLHSRSNPDKKLPFRWSMQQLIKSTVVPYAMTMGMIIAITYPLTMADDTIHPYRCNVYLAIFGNNCYLTALNEGTRYIFQRESVEGQKMFRRRHRKIAPIFSKRFWRCYVRSMRITVFAFAAVAYVHVSGSIQLSSQSDVVIFSFVSMAFKSVILRLSRLFVLKNPKVQLTTAYIAAVVPTVLINTQVRLLLLRTQTSWTINGLVILALLEPVNRIFKIWMVHREIDKNFANAKSTMTTQRSTWRRHRSSISPVTASDTHVHGYRSKLVRKPSYRDMQSAFEHSRRRLLYFHAAESQGDMCSEYIAIACSMTIYYLFRTHPKLGWETESTADSFTQIANTNQKILGVMMMLMLQVIAEMVVDFICCALELASGIPFKNTDQFGGFLMTVFVTCAVTTVGISSALYAKNNHKH